MLSFVVFCIRDLDLVCPCTKSVFFFRYIAFSCTRTKVSELEDMENISSYVYYLRRFSKIILSTEHFARTHGFPVHL